MTRVYAHLAEKSHGKSQTSAIPRQTREAPAPSAVGPEGRHYRIAEAAYLRAERRGFLPGHEIRDWLEAETEVDQLLTPAS